MWHGNKFASTRFRGTSPDLGSCCCHRDVGVGVSMSRNIKFYLKGFKVMGKALSGELSRTRTGLVIFA